MDNKMFYTKTEVDKMIYDMRQELISYINNSKTTNSEGVNIISDEEENNDAE